MELKKKTYTYRNMMAFILLSMIYIHSIYLFSIGETIWSVNSIKLFFQENYFVLLSGGITCFSVARFKKYSGHVLFFFLGLIVAKNFLILFSSLNKLVLILNFSYIFFAFFFYISWDLELKKAAFNPKFNKRDLEKEERFKLKGSLIEISNHEIKNECTLTNLDKNGCFIIVKETKKLEKEGSYVLSFKIDEVLFSGPVHIVSKYDCGYGLSFGRVSANRFNLREMYKVCLERGIFS